MPELGETTDPKALVPGDPGALRAVAQRWHKFGEALDTTRDGLGNLDTGPWAGEGQRAFATYIEQTMPTWSRNSEALRTAGDAVTRYAEVLEWARGEAGTAISDWEQGRKEQAEESLARIRQQVAAAGDDAAGKIRSAGTQTPQIRTMAEPDEDDDEDDDAGKPNDPVRQPNKWDDAPPGHPDPGSINADDRRAHILWGDHENPEQESGGHHHDSGIPGKTVFPERWDSDTIIDNAEDLGRNPDSDPVQQPNGNWKIVGNRDGVDMVVIVNEDGEIVTTYPTGGEGVAKNDDEGEPQLLEPEEDDDGQHSVDTAEEDQKADEAEQDAGESEEEAREHEERADDAARAGDEDTASEESAAAQESRDEAEAGEQLAERHRETAERAREADEEVSRWS